MRLAVLEHGHRRRARLFVSLVRRLSGHPPDAVARTALYRPEFFGRAFLALVRHTLRGPSGWLPEERELFAAWVSRLNQCQFCVDVHTGVAARGLGPRAAELLESRDGDDPEVTTVLALLEKVTLAPDDVPVAEMAAARAAGVDDQRIEDALHVAFVFNTVNRLAHAFDYTWSSAEELTAGVTALHRLGYRVPAFLLR